MCNCSKSIVGKDTTFRSSNSKSYLNSHTDGVGRPQSNIINPTSSFSSYAAGAIRSQSNIIIPGPTGTTSYLKSKSDRQNTPASMLGGFMPPRIYKEDSLLNYREAIKNKTITPQQLGKFMSLYDDYNLEYPDLMTYGEETQARVISSVFRKIGVIDCDLPYQQILDVAKRYAPAPNSTFGEYLTRFRNEGLLTANQVGYLAKMMGIVAENLKEGDIHLNNGNANNSLENLSQSISTDSDLTKAEIDSLVYTVKVIQGHGFPLRIGRKTTGSIILNSGTPIDCASCIEKHWAEILAWQAAVTAAFTAAMGIGLLAVGTAPALLLLGLVMGWEAAALIGIVGVVEFIKHGAYAKYCGDFCAWHHSGVIECKICPWYTYFFDGANCYLGWYASHHWGWIYDNAFWYYGDTASGCHDGNLNSSWGYVPFGAGGHGQPGGGIACLFGYNYDTSYVPWCSSSGFYVKPHCEQRW